MRFYMCLALKFDIRLLMEILGWPDLVASCVASEGFSAAGSIRLREIAQDCELFQCASRRLTPVVLWIHPDLSPLVDDDVRVP